MKKIPPHANSVRWEFGVGKLSLIYIGKIVSASLEARGKMLKREFLRTTSRIAENS